MVWVLVGAHTHTHTKNRRAKAHGERASQQQARSTHTPTHTHRHPPWSHHTPHRARPAPATAHHTHRTILSSTQCHHLVVPGIYVRHGPRALLHPRRGHRGGGRCRSYTGRHRGTPVACRQLIVSSAHLPPAFRFHHVSSSVLLAAFPLFRAAHCQNIPRHTFHCPHASAAARRTPARGRHRPPFHLRFTAHPPLCHAGTPPPLSAAQHGIILSRAFARERGARTTPHRYADAFTTAFVPSAIACFASSAGSSRRTAV